jgi:PAS domain S-box-containing protein
MNAPDPKNESLDLIYVPKPAVDISAVDSGDTVADLLRDLHSSAKPMWIFDTQSLAFLEVNEAAVRHYGYTPEQFLEMTILDIRPAEDIPRLLRDELRDRKYSADAELWHHRKRNGTVFDVKITSREIAFKGRVAEIVTVQIVDSKTTISPDPTRSA